MLLPSLHWTGLDTGSKRASMTARLSNLSSSYHFNPHHTYQANGLICYQSLRSEPRPAVRDPYPVIMSIKHCPEANRKRKGVSVSWELDRTICGQEQ